MELNTEKIMFDSIKKRCFCVNVAGKEAINNSAKILSVTAHSCCGRSEIVNNEIIIEGVVKYTAIIKDDENIKKIIKTERFSINEYSNEFSSNGNIITFSSINKVRGFIEAGNLVFSSVVDVCALVIFTEETEYVSSMDDEFRKKEQTLKFLKTNFIEKIRFNVNEETELSPRLPEINEILSVDASVNLKEAHISAGQLIFGGEITLQTVYNSLDEYEPVVQISDKLDFSQLIDLKDVFNDEPYVTLDIEDINTNIRLNEQNEMRIVQYNMELSGYAFAFEEITCNVISDAYSLKQKVKCDEKLLNYTYVGKENLQQINKNISVKLPDGCNHISRVNSVSFNASIVDKEILDSKVILKCLGDAGIIYSASNSGETDGFNTSVEFELILDKTDFDNAKNILSNLTIGDMQAILISGDKVEIRALFNVKSIPEFEINEKMIGDVIYSDEENFPEYGIIIYNIKKDDTLWEIAKKYGVDIDEILKLNNGLTENLEEDKKIFIFRKLII